MDFLAEYLRGLPNFLAYFAAGFVLIVLFKVIYTTITPQNEDKLIREGNMAAALSFWGAQIGFMLPLASVITHSVSIRDMALWALIALVVQLLAFFLARWRVPDLKGKIEANNISAGMHAGGISLGMGILNAACMTY